MSNEFIDYLNSMNNASSSTINALAESQVTNPYYSKIKIDRRMGKYIADSIINGEKMTYILTGHAGDGKTSILVQVLSELKLLSDGETLDVETTITRNNLSLHYVKDMSEVDEDKQEIFLRKALNANASGVSSLLISNTGPLMRTFERIVRADHALKGEAFTEKKEIELQTRLLDQLDSNTNEIITVEGYRFKLINIARVDNVNFANKIIAKITNKELWQPCEECFDKDSCPMYYNYTILGSYRNRISEFVENFYRYLYENDRRATIRQMIAQISFAFTGNLSCADVTTGKLKNSKFRYNFANLFFGFRGIEEFENAIQIKGIEQINNYNIDSIALNVDYELFVNNNFSSMPDDIRKLIESVYFKFSKKYYSINIITTEKMLQEKEALMRKAVRRFYLMYSSYDDISQLGEVFNQIFGEVFSVYKRAISKQFASGIERRNLSNLVFDALNINNTGFHMQNNETLYLTLRRDDEAFQNVLLITGKMEKDAFKIVQEKTNSQFEDTNEKYDVYIMFGETVKFKLNLPLLTYFKAITNGAITSINNPSLTHGIARLNTMLHDFVRDKNKDGIMRLLINTTKEQQTVTCIFDEGKLIIE